MRRLRVWKWSTVLMGLLILLGTVSAVAGANVVPVTRLGMITRTNTPNDFRPPACTASMATVLAGGGTITGNTGNDLILGSPAGDTIYGGLGNDCLMGGGGFDWLFGEDGNDYLNGGPGFDLCFGGAGVDTYDASCELQW